MNNIIKMIYDSISSGDKIAFKAIHNKKEIEVVFRATFGGASMETSEGWGFSSALGDMTIEEHVANIIMKTQVHLRENIPVPEERILGWFVTYSPNPDDIDDTRTRAFSTEEEARNWAGPEDHVWAHKSRW